MGSFCQIHELISGLLMRVPDSIRDRPAHPFEKKVFHV